MKARAIVLRIYPTRDIWKFLQITLLKTRQILREVSNITRSVNPFINCNRIHSITCTSETLLKHEKLQPHDLSPRYDLYLFNC